MKKPVEETLLQLDGKIYIVKKKNGRTVRRDEIDGKLVLDAIMTIIRREVDRKSRERKNEKIAKA